MLSLCHGGLCKCTQNVTLLRGNEVFNTCSPRYSNAKPGGCNSLSCPENESSKFLADSHAGYPVFLTSLPTVLPTREGRQ